MAEVHEVELLDVELPPRLTDPSPLDLASPDAREDLGLAVVAPELDHEDSARK
jgi:hypothetical protein